MTTHRRPTASSFGPKSLSSRFSFVPCLAGPERLVGLGFRYWMAGYKTGDLACWEDCWQVYEASLGIEGAREAVGDLSCWVRSMTSVARRDIEVFPGRCRGFCRDECAAVSLIAAMQHGACPAFKICTALLLATEDCDAVLYTASAFAGTLRDAGQILSPNSLMVGERNLCPQTATRQ